MTTSDDGEVLEFIGSYTITRTHRRDGDYLTAACAQCREIVTVIATWKTRHQQRAAFHAFLRWSLAQKKGPDE